MNRLNLLITLAIPVLLSQNVQGQSRLIATANWSHDGAEFKRHDSTAYNYTSNARGGDLNTQLKFDEATNWSYVMGDTANKNTRSVQEFDANNNLLTTVTQTWDGTFTFSWVNEFKYIYSYNSSNKKVSMVTQHWDGTSAWITDSKNTYSYNAANQLYLDQYLLWDGVSTYNPSRQKTYYFDASGNVINETDVLFVAGTPTFTSDTDYTYNSANKLLTKTGNTWSGSAWVSSVRWTNFYDTATGNNTNRLTETYDGTAFVNSMQMMFSDFNANHMAMTEIDQVWDPTGSGSWVDQYKYTYTYNANNQLTSATRQSNDISIGWAYAFGDTKSLYYYGSFVNAVNNVSNVGGNATLYPVPAQNEMNIDLNWNHAQAATIVISDMQGKIVAQWNTPSAVQHHSTVNISNYAPGVYSVKIAGTEGQIVKQIVVAR